MKVSARNPPNKQSMKDVPMKLVTTLAEEAFPICMVPVRYVTKLTAIPRVVNLSHPSIPDRSQEKTDQIWITLYVCMCAFFLSNKIIIELNNEKKGKIGDLRSWQRKSNHQFWISLLDDPCSPKHLGWFGPVFEEECSFWMWVVKWKFWYQERDWGSVAQRELKV